MYRRCELSATFVVLGIRTSAWLVGKASCFWVLGACADCINVYTEIAFVAVHCFYNSVQPQKKVLWYGSGANSLYLLCPNPTQNHITVNQSAP